MFCSRAPVVRQDWVAANTVQSFVETFSLYRWFPSARIIAAMIKLTREVRFSLVPGHAELDSQTANSWGGWPSGLGVHPYIVLRCTVAGNLDPTSGYLCNIKLIDEIARKEVIAPVCKQPDRFQTLPSLLSFAQSQMAEALPSELVFQQLEIRSSPYLALAWNRENPDMICLTHQFEFSASHRLHNPELGDQENHQLFGKCNHPHGHGHNYVVDVTINAKQDQFDKEFELANLNRVVKSKIIDRFDHKHLNIDDPIFESLNPTVENITQTIFDLLKPDLGSALKTIRVYETPKTWAEVSA